MASDIPNEPPKADPATRTAKAFGAAAEQIGQQAQQAIGQFNRALSEMKLPGMPDVQALLTAHRKNMETLSAVNRVALEGAQAVARRHTEILQHNMQELSESMQALAANDTPQAQVAKQAELIKRAYERAVADMKELGELIQRSNNESLELLNRRFSEAMDEVKALIEKGSA